MTESLLKNVQLWLLRKPSGITNFGDLLRIRVMPPHVVGSATIPSKSARPLMIHKIADDAKLLLTMLGSTSIKKCVDFKTQGAEFFVFTLNGELKPSLTRDTALEGQNVISMACTTMEGILANEARVEFFLPGFIYDLAPSATPTPEISIFSLRFF